MLGINLIKNRGLIQAGLKTSGKINLRNSPSGPKVRPILKFFILFLSLFIASEAFAADSAVVDPGPVEGAVRTELRVLADRIDDIFGRSRADANKSTSTLRLSVNEKMENGKADEPSFGVRFNLKLATLQRWNSELNDWFNKKVHHLEDEWRKEHESAKKGPPKIDRLRPGEKESTEKDPWRFSIEKKANVAKKLGVKAQLGVRVDKDIETAGYLHSFSSDLGWSTDNLWQSSASFTSSHRITSRLLFSFGNSAGWSISRKSFSTNHGPSLSYAINEHQATSLSFGVGTAIIEKVWGVQSYSVSASYRLETLHDWVFFSFSPYIEWARGNHFVNNSGFNSGLEIVF